MNNKTLFLLLFFFILGVATILRIYDVTSIPPGVNRDEASIGYTAYSLLQTGKDEYGRLYPISFQSFGDWKLPLYLYSVIPFVKIFGLSELSVRFTSITVGILTVFLTYFLIKELTHKKGLALLSMGLVAISPWHLHLSRVESESNTAVFLTVLAVYLFLKSLKSKHWYFVISMVLFSLTYYTYAGNYIFTTLLLFGLAFLYRNEVVKGKWFFAGLTAFILLSGYIFSQTIFGANTTKLSGINIFGDPSIVHEKIELPRSNHQNPNGIISRITHNRFVFGTQRFIENYLNAFSPEFLFIKGGGNMAHNIQKMGNMYLIEAPFLFAGIVYLFFIKKTKGLQLVIWWFIVAPIAASITKDAPHTNRMFAIFPMLSSVTAFGIYYLYDLIGRKKIYIFLVIIIFICNFLLYIDRYYIHFPKNEVGNWGFGYKNLVTILNRKENLHRSVIMTRPEYSPYIFILFYSRYDPLTYQKTAVRYPVTGDRFIHVKKFDRYEFRDIEWENDLKIPNRILIAHPSEVPEHIKKNTKQEKIILPNGEEMFFLIKTR